MKKIIAKILMVAGLAAGLAAGLRASDLDYAYRLPAEIQTPGPVALDELTWQQGTTPLLGIEVLRRGRSVTAETNTIVRMIIGPSATGTYYAVTTNTASATTGSYYYVQWPTIGTNSAGTGTVARAWWYTVYFERSGVRYWTGNGDLYIEPTTSTDPDGLVWQEILTGVYSVFGRDGAVVATSNDYADFYVSVGSAGASTNLSDYNNDVPFLTEETASPVLSVFGRTNDVLAMAADYALYYSPTGHTHVMGDVTGLQTALNAKAGTGDVAAVASDLATHETGIGVHAMAAVLGLQTALDGKAATNNPVLLSALTNATEIVETNVWAFERIDAHQFRLLIDTNDFADAVVVNWGDIGGTLSSQLDLQNELNAKAETGDVAAVASDLDAHELLTTNAHGGIVADDDARMSDARTPLAHDQAWSTITSTPTTIAGYGLTDAVNTNDSRLSDARTPTAHDQDWGTITGTPDNAEGYGMTNDFIFEGDSRLTDARDPNAHDQDWTTITGTPDTVSGYGITDAWTRVESDSRYGTTSEVAQVASDLSDHESATGTAVHGLGTMAIETAADYYTAGEADTLLDGKATNLVDLR